MPHKKNPIISERIAGMARIVRAQVVPVMEGIPLWHERDISHSSTERIALPDASIATDYMLHLTLRLVNGLIVNAERMRANLDSTGGLIYSSSVLLELVEGGCQPRGRVRARAVRGDGDVEDRGRRSARPCASTPPIDGSSWTRRGSTRCAARSATSSGWTGSSSGWRRCRDRGPAAPCTPARSATSTRSATTGC